MRDVARRGKGRIDKKATGGGKRFATRGDWRFLAFDEAHFAGARPFARVLGRELHPLTLPQQLENRTTDGAPVEEVLDSTFIPDETEPLVDEQARDGPGWHTSSDERTPGQIPGALQAELQEMGAGGRGPL